MIIKNMKHSITAQHATCIKYQDEVAFGKGRAGGTRGRIWRMRKKKRRETVREWKRGRDGHYVVTKLKFSVIWFQCGTCRENSVKLGGIKYKLTATRKNYLEKKLNCKSVQQKIHYSKLFRMLRCCTMGLMKLSLYCSSVCVFVCGLLCIMDLHNA